VAPRDLTVRADLAATADLAAGDLAEPPDASSD